MLKNRALQFITKAVHPTTFYKVPHNLWADLADSISTQFLQEHHCHCYNQKCFLVRLKWVKHSGFDHIIERDVDLKAVCMLKDIVRKHPDESLPITSVSRRQRELGLTFQVIRFMRRYRTIFREFAGPKYDVPWFGLTKEALELDEEEQKIHEQNAGDSVQRLCKLLMMTRSKKLPLKSIEPLKWDLGLPRDYVKTLIPKYSDYFSIAKMQDGDPGLTLLRWNDEFAVSALQKQADDDAKGGNQLTYRNFKAHAHLTYEMNFPSGYGHMNKVISWMEEWQRLPYVSPYEDPSNLDPIGTVMEKRVVGVYHELLSLTIHKKLQRNNLNCFCEEMSLPERFTKLFTRYPGIFYYSLKCSTSTVVLKEGYQNGQVVEQHPLLRLRKKLFRLMRMGISPNRKDLDKRVVPFLDHKPDKHPYRGDEVSRHHYEEEGSSDRN